MGLQPSFILSESQCAQVPNQVAGRCFTIWVVRKRSKRREGALGALEFVERVMIGESFSFKAPLFGMEAERAGGRAQDNKNDDKKALRRTGRTNPAKRAVIPALQVMERGCSDPSFRMAPKG